MTQNQKVVAWVSIVGAGLGAGLATAINFFPDLTAMLTAVGGLISAVVAYIVTKKKDG